MAELLKVGDRAPDFSSVDQDGKDVKLSSFTGSPVVLYFYPKDDTPGCTREACAFRDSQADYEGKGVKVLGVSVDDAASHRKFQEKYKLNFTLVADDSTEISRAYGTLKGSMASRVTYIIDRDGKIAHVYPSVTPDTHSAEVMGKLAELGLVH